MHSDSTLPSAIRHKIDRLNQIADDNPDSIPLKVAAEFMGMSDDGLRCALDQSKCAFGFSWQQKGAANRGFKIPTVPFYMWYLQKSGINL